MSRRRRIEAAVRSEYFQRRVDDVAVEVLQQLEALRGGDEFTGRDDLPGLVAQVGDGRNRLVEARVVA
jgi:Mg-chelatase subunit ChlI